MKFGLVHKNECANPESVPENEPFMEFLPEITSLGAEVILPAESKSHPFPRTAIWAYAGHTVSNRKAFAAKDSDFLRTISSRRNRSWCSSICRILPLRVDYEAAHHACNERACPSRFFAKKGALPRSPPDPRYERSVE